MRDLRDFYDPHLYATINGTRFRVDCPTAAEGFKLRAVMADPKRAAEMNEIEVINQLFKGTLSDDPTEMPTGGLWDEMAEAGVTWPEMLHLGITAIHFYGLGKEVALRWWDSASTTTDDDAEESGETGKAPTPKKKPVKKTS